jgi:hypothetical protein
MIYNFELPRRNWKRHIAIKERAHSLAHDGHTVIIFDPGTGEMILIEPSGSEKVIKKEPIENKKCCDNCKWYEWYWDKCTKWDCECDAREIHSCYERGTGGIKING